jgi:archaellin
VKIIICTILMTFVSVFSQTNPGWYTVNLSSFKAIDYSSSEINIQAEDGSAKAINQGSSTFQATEIKITPPAGKENIWLSMILTAASTGSKIRVLGNYSGTVLTVTSTGKLAAIF